MPLRRSPQKPAAATGPSPDDDDALSETIRVLTPEYIQAIITKNQQLERRLEALEKEATTQHASPTPSEERTSALERPEIHVMNVHEPKVGKPKKFSGKHSEFLSFIMQCEATFKMRPNSYPSDEYKVLFIITNLDGSALRWAQDVFAKDDHPYRKDYTAFRNALFSLYDNHTYHQDAEDRLLSLKQTKSASAYAVEFQTLAAPLGYNDKALCGMFFKGLKTAVKNAIMQQGRTKTFEELRDQAVRFDQHQHRMRIEESKTPNPHPPPEGRKSSRPGTNTTTSAKPVDDRVNYRTDDRAGDSRKRKFSIPMEEYERRRNLHLCFRCGDAGHTAEECTKKKPREGMANTTTRKKRKVDSPDATTSIPHYPPPALRPQSPSNSSNWQSQARTRSEA
jgi:hypothetical protein